MQRDTPRAKPTQKDIQWRKGIICVDLTFVAFKCKYSPQKTVKIQLYFLGCLFIMLNLHPVYLAPTGDYRLSQLNGKSNILPVLKRADKALQS